MARDKTPQPISKLEKLVKDRKVTPDQLHAIMDHIQAPDTNPRPAVKHYWSKTHTRIGILGDVHIGSKYVDYAVLDDMMKRFKDAGVDAVYQVGDITEGYNRRKGHSLECELHGADEQVRGVVERLPSIGKPIYFIGGDHDSWHYESAGVDTGKSIEQKRKDMHYLGPFNGTIELAKNTKLDLVHPAKGTAYALSYHPQKMAEAFSGGEKPNILVIGHYHKIEYLFYRNIHIFQAGCVQSQTPWMRRMNLSAHKAAWLLDVYTKTDGTIDKLETKLFPYYT